MYHQTADYSMFKKHPNNRELCPRNIEKIKNSLQLKNLLHLRPLLVDSDFRLIDGQHRLEAAKQLMIPVFYSVIENAIHSDIITLNNNQKQWKLNDYLNYYCHEGIESYLTLRSFIEKKDMSINCALTLFAHKNGDVLVKFRNGTFEVKETFQTRCALYMEVETFLNHIRMLKVANKLFLKQTRFLKCLLAFIRREDINFDVFKKKVELKIDAFHSCHTQVHYMNMFKEIYNYRNSEPIND
jgi:hypothetical protein